VPRLYVVPTPIGNLEDITLRALRVLREVSLILAEDTRHTRKLLQHHGITGRLLSYHQHTKQTRLGAALQALETGDVALVTDAGMPSVSDPGFELIRAARERGFEVDVLPGPSAVLTAVAAAAMPGPGFLFLGFLPRKSGERRRRLSQVAGLPYALVVFEAPHRLEEVVQDMARVMGERPVAMCRELSKIHQEVWQGTLRGLEERVAGEGVRGEITLVVGGSDREGEVAEEAARDEMRRRRRAGEPARIAIAGVTATYGLTRNDAYRLWLEVGE
jgi:16S rRNA (cytidine1402-2'-O)-methyltransferase